MEQSIISTNTSDIGHPDRIMVMLSLIFSMYSPLGPLNALMIRMLVRMEKKFLITFTTFFVVVYMGLLFVSGVNGASVFSAILSAYLAIYIILYNTWIYHVKHHCLVDGVLAFYPIHSLLRNRMTRVTGAQPEGEYLYEVHINPILVKRIETGKQNRTGAGMQVAHAAKHLTFNLSKQSFTVSVVGTTYEPRLANVATTAAKRFIGNSTHQSGVSPLGAKWLFPKKQWTTFLWEIRFEMITEK